MWEKIHFIQNIAFFIINICCYFTSIFANIIDNNFHFLHPFQRVRTNFKLVLRLFCYYYELFSKVLQVRYLNIFLIVVANPFKLGVLKFAM